jgi:hypothetical protein
MSPMSVARLGATCDDRREEKGRDERGFRRVSEAHAAGATSTRERAGKSSASGSAAA